MDVLSTIRDIAIIILVAEQILIGLALLALVIGVWVLVRLVRRHIDTLANTSADILNTTADTARTVRGTTEFVADQTAKPLVEIVSTLTAASRAARAGFGPDSNGKDSK